MRYWETKSYITFKPFLMKLGLFLIISGVLYMISLENYLLFRITVNLFNVIIAYMVFIIVWKSKTFSENRYLTFIGTALFFIACLGFLRAFAYENMNVFPGYGANLPVQLWIAMRYLISISLFVAPLFFIRNSGNESSDSEKRYLKPVENGLFAQKVFFVYSAITAALLLSIFRYGNFPDCYIEDSGLTDFKIFSEYIISLLLIGSLFLLYRKKDRFERHVFRILIAAIIASILAELALVYYTNTEELLNFIGQIFNALSFYLIYIAIVETGFDEPCSLLFRELKFREEALRREANFLKDDQGRIYRMLGVEKSIPESKILAEKLQDKAKEDKAEQYKTERYRTEQYKTEQYSSFLQDMQGLIAFRLDKKGALVFIDGDVEKITGYSRDEFISGKMKWIEIVLPEYRPLIIENLKKMELNPNSSTELEYRIKKKDGDIRWLREITHVIPGKSGISGKFQGFVRDITQRKKAEETLARTEEARIKEIHHRIKNNLQVISSLLSLQAEKLGDRETFQSSEVFEAFRESQNRVTSIALIHEELYQGKDMETLDFSAYLRRLTADLLRSYSIENKNIDVNMELEPAFLEMDTSVPLGIIANELISNALKHAFSEGKGGEIRISFFRSDRDRTENRISGIKKESGVQFTLIIADNGKGIPENIDLRNADSLGFQLVNILVEQIEGSIELKRDFGTEFRITFRKPET